jgi:agmatinase
MDAEERSGIVPDRIFYAWDIINSDNSWMDKAIGQLSQNVYITIDLDGLDPAFMPSTGTPEPGGLNYYQVLDLVRATCKAKNVVGFDVVELCPNPANKSPDFLAAKLIYQVLSSRFA